MKTKEMEAKKEAITIDIKEFEHRFEEAYSYLYENDEAFDVAGYRDYMEAVDAFDALLKTQNGFVCAFAEYRHDVIISDREAVAFMLALKSFLE